MLPVTSQGSIKAIWRHLLNNQVKCKVKWVRNLLLNLECTAFVSHFWQ